MSIQEASKATDLDRISITLKRVRWKGTSVCVCVCVREREGESAKRATEHVPFKLQHKFCSNKSELNKNQEMF